MLTLLGGEQGAEGQGGRRRRRRREGRKNFGNSHAAHFHKSCGTIVIARCVPLSSEEGTTTFEALYMRAKARIWA
jgi:hypothetical protein